MIITFLAIPSQSFNTTINDIDYKFELNYNALYSFFVLDIMSEDFTIKGIKLVLGTNLLRQFINAPFALNPSGTLEAPTLETISSYNLEVVSNV